MNTDALLIDHLKRRWRAVLDITSVEQAQSTLNLPHSTSQRIRIHDALTAAPHHWRSIKACGATPVTVTLTETEKRFARKIQAGQAVEQAADDLAMASSDVRSARRVLTAVGLLQRGRIAPDAGRLLGGLGLQSHTVRVEGEPAFNVP